MNRKIVLGVLAWLPIACVFALAIYLVTVVGDIVLLGPGMDLEDENVRHFVIVLFGGASAIAVLQILFSVAFIIDAATKTKLEGLAVGLWAVGFVFFGEILFPVYWLLYVARSTPDPPSPPDRHWVAG